MPLSPQPKTMEWSHQSTNSRSRSNPIVICESLSKLQIRKQDDDDDDEDDQQQQQRQALSTSLPPGAPQLGSMKGSKGRLAPPPMTLADRNDLGDAQGANDNDFGTGSTYGSLRDSHLEGKFMDGPASYRDRTSGEIKFLQHRNARLKLNDGATSYRTGQSLSSSLQSGSFLSRSFSSNHYNNTTTTNKSQPMTLGDRLRASPKVMASDDSKKSGLSSMLEGAEPLPTAAAAQKPSIPTLADSDQHFSSNTDNSQMMSTSLTGLELLQAARRNHNLLAKPSSYPAVLPPLPPQQQILEQPPMHIPPQPEYLSEDVPFDLDME